MALLGTLLIGAVVATAFLMQSQRGAVAPSNPGRPEPAVPDRPVSPTNPTGLTDHLLSGVVRDELQAPVSTFGIVLEPVEVTRTQAEQLPGMPFADPHGRFEVRTATSGPWSLLVRSEGFVPLWLSPVSCDEPLQLQMQRPALIHGRTFGPDGLPIGGIGLEVFSARTPLDVEYRVDSTPDGYFHVTPKKPGGYLLRVGGETKTDFLVCMTGAPVHRDVHVPPATTVVCRVAGDGQPLAGVLVTLRCGTANRVATSDATGSATWTCVPRGHHVLTVSIGGYAAQMHVIDTTRKDETKFGRTIELTRQAH
ncbi:MAG: carboxypeptidase-like regulatory domain-containing protein [Planctomycetota bacterium]